MQNETLNVQMLGGFSLSLGEKIISCQDKRSPRVWNLLAYLVFFHQKAVSSDELITALWGENSDNPANALKTTLHRARALLDTLYPGAGHELILAGKGSYRWNQDCPISLDCREMEHLLHRSEAEPEQQLELLLEALSLYQGGFLDSQSAEAWSIPYSTYYQQLYLQALYRAVPLLEQEQRYEEAAALCRSALQHDPYAEATYQLLMRCLLALHQREQVVALYEEMSKLLLSNFGVMPDQESRALYHEALRTVNPGAITPEQFLEQMQEPDPISSALCCDFDFFKIIYQAQARVLARSGDAVHTALLTLKAKAGRELSSHSLELAMDNVQSCVAHSLRKGDVISRCSSSQFVIMLPQANYENSCMVCRRLQDNFRKKYPHSPVLIDFFVQPLIPSTEN